MTCSLQEVTSLGNFVNPADPGPVGLVGQTVSDVIIGDSHDAYLVRPHRPAGPAVIFLHWFDEAPNANRSQYLDEAKLLAEQGVTSLLPQLKFPWHSPPTDLTSDLARINDETRALNAGYEMLVGQTGVDPERVAVVGHDFGAMHGALLLRQVDTACAVLVAPTGRWSDWFLEFWPTATDRFDYMRGMDQVDPVSVVADLGCPVLFQFARDDFYIAPMTGQSLFRAAGEPKEIQAYEGGHDLEVEAAQADRLRFLRTNLSIVD